MNGLSLVFEAVNVKVGDQTLLEGIDWVIRPGEQWALVGPSGSGKTVLAHTLLGRYFYAGRISIGGEAREIGGEDRDTAGEHPGVGDGSRIAMVEQQHRFKNLYGTSDLYYQQRFNSYDAEQTMTVEQELAEYGGGLAKWIDDLHIRPLLKKPLIQLSNGENRRVQLAIALSGSPSLMILDNPFLGLDAEGRETLRGIMGALAGRGMQYLLITSANEIPGTITHVAELDKGRMQWSGTKGQFFSRRKEGAHEVAGTDAGKQAPPARGVVRQEPPAAGLIRQDPPADDFSVAVKFTGVTVRYGETTILEGIDWEVRRGERWSLSGPNGAGKSTILSLITADNPQAYANEIWLFDRRRGSGESIWEIKKRIGLVSPELHLYFDPSATCFDAIASGLYDTIGLFRTPADPERALVERWMEWLLLHDFRNKRLLHMPAGQQRMALLARALIKNPSLLILDEPCQGLDEEQKGAVLQIVDQLYSEAGRTLIYVSHYPDELPGCIDRWLQIQQGRVF